jgi:hypothetical protein
MVLNNIRILKFEVLMEVKIKTAVSWDRYDAV